MPLTRAQAYTEAGVNIDAGNSLVSRIKSIVSQTHIHGVLSDIGGFGGLFKPDMSGMAEPVLVASTDGVGTKLKLAFAFDKHDTVGIDLVPMIFWFRARVRCCSSTILRPVSLMWTRPRR